MGIFWAVIGWALIALSAAELILMLWLPGSATRALVTAAIGIIPGWLLVNYASKLRHRKARTNADKEAKIAASVKSCPFCAETVKVEAVVCRYCGRDLPDPVPQQRAASAPAQKYELPDIFVD